MAILLSIETSTSVCSVALHENGKLVATLELHRENSHASKLAALVDDVFKVAGVRMNEISAVGVSAGPGSYTGLRIGTSLAKGLCYALDIPLISVPTLHVMAAAVSGRVTKDALLCPMIDARRMEVYCQFFSRDLKEQSTLQAVVVDEGAFENYLKSGVVIFFGSGVEKCEPLLRHEHAKFLRDVHPLATYVGALAYDKFARGEVENLAEYVPLYLKEFFIKKPVEA
jgi:tRNA threonylcarbamoyladenosine biosynthesis protein TsaB